MRLSMKTLAFIAALTICVQGSAQSQNATDQLQPLMETSAHRLVIAEQVALAKWDSGTAVEDASREAQVIASAVTAGESKGLDPAVVSDFFRAQIEANKLVQYSLLAEWRRLGRAPDHKPVNLAGTIRRELDQLGTELIAKLTETAALRASPSCQTDIAKAVGKYASAHKNSFDTLKAIALDRAMAAACNVGGNSQ
jgi:chorismate mutase